MDEKIYLHYTKAELDKNFDQRSWAKNADEVIARYTSRSRETRKRYRHWNMRYGFSDDETLDVFLASRRPAPVHIFVHGGAWRHFTKDDVSFVAESFVPAGVHLITLNFSNLPVVQLPEMVSQVSRGIAWVYQNAARFQGDPQRIFVSGHSSGAHLVAMALTTDWRAHGLPDDIVKAATCISGPYDLEPVVLSARGSYIHLSKEEQHRFSPPRHAGRISCPVMIVYAEYDTDEFQRQSREFALALKQVGRLANCVCLSGMNHFEAMESFGTPDGILIGEILSQMGYRRLN